MYYIMNASCLFDNKAATLEDIGEQWPDGKQTVLVCRRNRSSWEDKYSQIFVVGSGLGYEAVPPRGTPIVARYTQDTGNGHSCKGFELLIDNVIEIEDGAVHNTGNTDGVHGRRRVWVMK